MMQGEKGGEKIIVKVPEYALQLVPNFLENREKDINKIGESLEKGDFETIERLGHSMKGSGSIYGFDGITELGKAIEMSAKEKNPEGIKNNISELKNYLGRVEIVNE
jgi:HPt (histidine-containing phosphotransfer) domain-containing protein